jgi:Tfp pilus assembly protein PilX
VEDPIASTKPDRFWRGRRGFVLLTALVFLTVIMILGASMISQTIQELNTASRIKRDTQALNIAEAGVDYAAWRLYKAQVDGGVASLPATYTRSSIGGGSFSATVSAHPTYADTVVIASTGTVTGYTAEVKVVGQFLKTEITGQNQVFDYALFSNSDITMNGTFDVYGNTFANGSTTVQGAARIHGNASGVGVINGASKITGTVAAGQPRVGMPTVDLSYYKALAKLDATYYGSETSVPNPIGFGPNGVVYVEGDLHINGQFSGKGVVVASGRITINGQATLVNPATDSFALISPTSVRINGGAKVDGWIYSHSVTNDATFTGTGTSTMVGGIAADIIKNNGTCTVTFKTPWGELPGAEHAPRQFDAVSWRRVK